MEKNLSELLPDINYRLVRGPEDQKITGLHYDSRTVESGGAFVAIPGRNTDGHEYIAQAIESGAGVVFGEIPRSEIEGNPKTYVRVENSRKLLASVSHLFFDRPTKELFVAGITGTNGKTTTAHLTGNVLGKQTNLVTTLTHSDSLPEKEPVTTPEAPVIHEKAQKSLEKGIKNLVLEVSSHGLSLDRVACVDFDCGVFTNLTRDHLDFYDSMEEYAAGKVKLFTGLTEDDNAVLNSDEPLSDRIIAETRAEIVKYGIDEDSDVLGDKINKKKTGTTFRINSPWGTEEVNLNFPGLYNVYNALAAASIGLLRGIDLSRIVERLKDSGPLPGRLDKLELKNGADVYVDFAHNPGALERTLLELKEHYEEIFLVFGCGGMSDRGKRPEMGKIAAKHSDRFFITDDNPKGEDRTSILAEIEEGVGKGSNYEVIPERKSAIEAALDELAPGSCLLVAGKGHERYQVISGDWVEYNDREFLEKLTRKKSLR
ncbi:UDP-N-acetylmuramoyl-L-alanyl-D-glutamate--2,6-diaminopimelate ligase [Candidatus Bipolaricaulota bacterium]|nr:UDP-N-acetylmuramoyl-L-alanyl-D-glutamate--2,6-diaminopimelate ligase [Candidatus Bipolaricaulota bacterium]MBS3792178.1 UDP-N-acetylmuramoyl-L-alanyl-D-glutamate--2,6-diaminopimelate ligase [Candidatus Bipolaricaulota bacterium]